MTSIVTRAQWGARPPKRRTTGNLKETSTVHWNGPKMPDVSHDKCASVVRGTQNFHMDQRGWSDIAYNFLVCRHGYIFEGRGLNVWNGANGTNYGNQTSHAVMALVGTGNVVTGLMKQAIKDAVAHIDARTAAPGSPVRGHRDHKSTECPGNELYTWVHAGLPIKQEDKEKMMFAEGTDYAGVVTTAYTKVVGRKPESQQVLDTWAWTLFTKQGEGYNALLSALIYEAHLKNDNKIKQMKNQLSILQAKIDNVPPPTQVTELTEEEILALVYSDLTQRLGA